MTAEVLRCIVCVSEEIAGIGEGGGGQSLEEPVKKCYNVPLYGNHLRTQ